MKTRGAIIRQPPGTYEVVTLDLDHPRQGEILVKMAASGLCHSDDHHATGDIPAATYPWCGGHEGAGVVVELGEAVKGFAEGDHVVFSFLPACGHCRWCASGMQNLCDLGAHLLVGSRFDDLTSFRMHLDGQPVGQALGISTFSEYTTVDIHSAVKIPKDVPLDKACLLGCGVGTGWGSAVNSAQVQVGDTVIVMGVGGVGINAVQGAAHAGASHVIAVDPVQFKREMAEKFTDGDLRGRGRVEPVQHRAHFVAADGHSGEPGHGTDIGARSSAARTAGSSGSSPSARMASRSSTT